MWLRLSNKNCIQSIFQHCTQCGNQIDVKDNFCARCGGRTGACVERSAGIERGAGGERSSGVRTGAGVDRGGSRAPSYRLLVSTASHGFFCVSKFWHENLTPFVPANPGIIMIQYPHCAHFKIKSLGLLALLGVSF